MINEIMSRIDRRRRLTPGLGRSRALRRRMSDGRDTGGRPTRVSLTQIPNLESSSSSSSFSAFGKRSCDRKSRNRENQPDDTGLVQEVEDENDDEDEDDWGGPGRLLKFEEAAPGVSRSGRSSLLRGSPSKPI